MKLKLEKGKINSIIDIIHDYFREGQDLNCLLTDYEVSQRKWDKFVSKHGKLQHAISDGLVYFNTFWSRKLARDLTSKRTNSTLAKMAYENNLGWSESAMKRNQKMKPKTPYNVNVIITQETATVEEKTIAKNKKKEARKQEKKLSKKEGVERS